MLSNQTPGVYREDIFLEPTSALRTGVPVFLGYTEKSDVPLNTARLLTMWPQYEQHFGSLQADCYLAHAVAGFFQNGGSLCYVVRLEENERPPIEALVQGLDMAATLDSIDLVCAPDIMSCKGHDSSKESVEAVVADIIQMQGKLLEHCDRLGDRLAILDAVGDAGMAEVAEPGQQLDAVTKQRALLSGVNGALYFPWVGVRSPNNSGARFIPPSGHIAGIFSRTDQRSGVHKAPANEILEGVTDLQYPINNMEQGALNESGINCLRTFPGRGIRVWGARTLSHDPAWTYVNVRRLFLTAGRWIDRHMAGMVYEPNDPRLWARIGRELTTYFDGLFRQGALRGNTPEEAFYVKCDAETNPPDQREMGRVVTEIGLAPGIPAEFIVVRIMHGAGGITITGPVRPT
jgi:uncharacterized protein